MKIFELKNTTTIKSSTPEWKEQRKESVNWKTEQQTLPNLNNREKIGKNQPTNQLNKQTKTKASGICGTLTTVLPCMFSES